MTSVIEIEGVGPVNAQKLEEINIKTVEALLERGASPQGRREIEEQTGISHSQVLRWINHADLWRIKGVAGQYAELLEAAGVDTVPELARRNPENLYHKLGEINREKRLVRRTPSLNRVSDWIEQAKELPWIVTYIR